MGKIPRTKKTPGRSEFGAVPSVMKTNASLYYELQRTDFIK